MSIPSPTPTTTSDPSLPSLDPVSTSGGGGQSANYFFGFLITFAVLLVVFIVAGIFSRRRVQARRAAALAAGMGVFGSQSWEDGLRRGRPVWIEQRLEDPVLVREKEKDTSADVNNGVSEKWRWKNIKPLCAVLTLPEHEELKPEAHDEDEKVRRGSISTISSWLSSFSTTKDAVTVQEEEHTPPVVPTEVQDTKPRVEVVVMIAMPCGPDSRGYEFGVASVPLLMNQGVDMHVVT